MLLLLGGPQASLTAQASLAAFPFVDAIFQGEAETSWREFIRQSQRGTVRWQEIPGIAWRNGADVHLNCPAPLIEDLDTLPEPALDLYAFSRCASVTPIEIGRGCPFACTFCTASPFFRRRFRLKPIARILQEMDAIFRAIWEPPFSISSRIPSRSNGNSSRRFALRSRTITGRTLGIAALGRIRFPIRWPQQ